mgnify:CR=1 FL=1
MGYLERIQAWKALISAYYSGACTEMEFANMQASNAQLFASENAEIGGDLEISFREVLGSLLDNSCDLEV